MNWCWHFQHHHGSGVADGEGIGPETDIGRARDDKLSLHLTRNHGEGVSGLNLGLPKVTFSQSHITSLA